MAVPPESEPFRSICIREGFLTREKADEVVNLQKYVAEKLGLPQEFLEICKQKGFITEGQAQTVLKSLAESRQRAPASERVSSKGGVRELAGFEVLGKIGEGAMGAVYKVRQKSLDRVVALKILPPKLAQNKLFVERFKREARASAALNHPNIVQGIDVGEAQGLHYFAMEFIDGQTLGERLKKSGRLPIDEVLEIGHQTALALAHAHKKNLVHRDIKPENIMLTTSAARPGLFSVKVMDLGLARTIQEGEASVTQTGMAVGTPYYISPEQARGDTNLTSACDLYALGGTLFHVVTGRPPFQGETSAVVMAKHLTEAVPNPKALRPDLPAEFAAILRKLLSKKPEDRYASADDLAEDLERLLKGEAPRHIAPAKGRGKSTGPMRPVTTRGGKPVSGRHSGLDDSDIPLPTGRLTHPPQAFPVVPVAIAAVLILVVLAAVVARSRSAPPEPSTPVTAATGSPVASPKSVTQPEAASDPDLERKKAQAQAEAKRKLWEQEYQGALTAAEAVPDNLETQERIWQRFLERAGESQFAEKAQSILVSIRQKRSEVSRAAAKAQAEKATELLAKQDLDAALASLLELPEPHRNDETDRILEEARQKIEQKSTELLASLDALAQLEKDGKVTEALAACGPLLTLKHKLIREKAAAKAKQLQERLDAAAEETSKGEFVTLLTELHPLVWAKSFKSAAELCAKAGTDPKLEPLKEELTLLQASVLRGWATLAGLVERRIREAGPEGLLPSKRSYRLPKPAKDVEGSGEDLTLKTAATPSAKGIRLRDLPWPLIFDLAGLRDQGQPSLKRTPEEADRLRLAGLLALLGQAELLKGYGDLAQVAKGPSEAAFKDLEKTAKRLEPKAIESDTRESAKEFQDLLEKRQLAEANACAIDLVASGVLGSPAWLAQAPKLAELAQKARLEFLEEEAKSVETKSLFAGNFKNVSKTVVHLDYDFRDPRQLQDFVVAIPGWRLDRNGLRTDERCVDPLLWHKARFSDKSQLTINYRGTAKSDLNCLLGALICPDTTAGLGFRFGRQKEPKTVVLDEKDQEIPSTGKNLPITDKNHSVYIIRNGPQFSWWIDTEVSKRPQISFPYKEAPSALHVALHTWKESEWNGLTMQGNLDADWLQEAKREFASRKRGDTVLGLTAVSYLALLNGRLGIQENTLRVAYQAERDEEFKDWKCIGDTKLVRHAAGGFFRDGTGTEGLFLHRATFGLPTSMELQGHVLHHKNANISVYLAFNPVQDQLKRIQANGLQLEILPHFLSLKQNHQVLAEVKDLKLPQDYRLLIKVTEKQLQVVGKDNAVLLTWPDPKAGSAALDPRFHPSATVQWGFFPSGNVSATGIILQGPILRVSGPEPGVKTSLDAGSPVQALAGGPSSEPQRELPEPGSPAGNGEPIRLRPGEEGRPGRDSAPGGEQRQASMEGENDGARERDGASKTGSSPANPPSADPRKEGTGPAAPATSANTAKSAAPAQPPPPNGLRRLSDKELHDSAKVRWVTPATEIKVAAGLQGPTVKLRPEDTVVIWVEGGQWGADRAHPPAGGRGYQDEKVPCPAPRASGEFPLLSLLCRAPNGTYFPVYDQWVGRLPGEGSVSKVYLLPCLPNDRLGTAWGSLFVRVGILLQE